jgi:hypothetical protein
MSAVFTKLNLKDQSPVFVVNAPDSFLPEMQSLDPGIKVVNGLPKGQKGAFVLGFCTRQKQVDELAEKADKILEGDGLLWIAYPKGTSKKFTCDFNRDTGWAILGKLGFEPVRQVAIDEDWSALRFRRVEYIKKMTRSFAMTEEGKKKTGKS